MRKVSRFAALAASLMALLLLTGQRPPAEAGPILPATALPVVHPQGPPDAHSTMGPTPPPELFTAGGGACPASTTMIRDVPSYYWRHGCGPTAAGMVLGYWDGRGFGRLVPGSATVQNAAVNAMMATGSSKSDIGTNYTDYCLAYNPAVGDYTLDDSTPTILPDKSEPPEGDEHPDHSVADFMQTSQSAVGMRYGWSWFNPLGPSMVDYVNWLGRPDYRADTRAYYMNYSPYLTWDLLRAEIDAGRPMVFLVDTGGDGSTDHFVTVVGYDQATHTYALHDTWMGVRCYPFAEMALGQFWGIWGGFSFDLQVHNPNVTRVTASGSERDSRFPALDADGSTVAFSSDHDILGEGIADEQWEIWLYDRPTMAYTRVTDAGPAGRESYMPSLNAAGTQVAFHSDADLLDQGIPNDQFEVWLYDTQTMTYTRVTMATAGARDSLAAVQNAGGNVVAFHSDADLLDQGLPDEQFEVWLYDTQAMTYTRVTASPAGTKSMFPILNDDGTRVAFHSDADLLDQGDIGSGQYEIWLYDTQAMTYTRVTTATAPNRDSLHPAIDGSGTRIVFHSDADLLGQGIPDEQYEIWLYDTRANTYTRITTATASNRDSRHPAISDDGTRIVFESDGDFLDQGIPDGQWEVWMYDLFTGTYTRLTWASDTDRGGLDPYDLYHLAWSGDGSYVAFETDSDILAQVIPNDQFEIWLYHIDDRPFKAFLPAALKAYPQP